MIAKVILHFNTRRDFNTKFIPLDWAYLSLTRPLSVEHFCWSATCVDFGLLCAIAVGFPSLTPDEPHARPMEQHSPSYSSKWYFCLSFLTFTLVYSFLIVLVSMTAGAIKPKLLKIPIWLSFYQMMTIQMLLWWQALFYHRKLCTVTHGPNPSQRTTLPALPPLMAMAGGEGLKADHQLSPHTACIWSKELLVQLIDPQHQRCYVPITMMSGLPMLNSHWFQKLII